MTQPKTQLVKVEELYADKELAYKNNEMNILLNSDPKEGWIKEHPYVKGLKYIPIERIEWLLTMIFQKWRVEVKNVKQIANSVVVTVRLHVFNPISGEWEYQDGIGATPLQVDKDAGAINWDKIKSGAVQMSAPSAETYAVKDAAEKFGKIFGKDMNRKDIISYDLLQDKFDDLSKAREEISNLKNLEELVTYYNANKGRGKEFEALLAEKKKFLTTIGK